MGGCSAINCSNNTRKGYRMFVFPADVNRRKQWIINCRRGSWNPTKYSQLCSEHFEDSQFEANRADGWKKLKRTAVPTLFNIPNPPQTLTDKRIKGVGCPKPNTLLASHLNEPEKDDEKEALLRKINILEREIERLKNAAKVKDTALSSFLSEEQISNLSIARSSIHHWSEETIIKALKLRCALGKRGYLYLRKTGYPLPSYSTIYKRIHGLEEFKAFIKKIESEPALQTEEASEQLCVSPNHFQSSECTKEFTLKALN